MKKNAVFTILVLCALLGKLGTAFSETRDPNTDRDLRFDPYGTGGYMQYAPVINRDEIEIILEIGSRDAIDAIRLGYFFNCPVYAFECNPEAIEICKYNSRNYPYVTVVENACWNETKPISFYPVSKIDSRFTFNLGGASCLVTRPNGFDSAWPKENPITVPAVRLDEWMKENNITHADLICMDTQGATLQVLEGLGEYLEKTKYIITEAYLVPSFEGEALYPEIRKFFEAHGFYLAPESNVRSPLCDLLFINRSLVIDR